MPHILSEGRDGFLRDADLQEHVRQSVMLLLTIRQGERFLQPRFGNKLHQFTFAPNSEALRKHIGAHVQQIISEQEPRVRDVEVEVQPLKKEPTRLSIEVSYKLNDSDTSSTVYVKLDLLGDSSAKLHS